MDSSVASSAATATPLSASWASSTASAELALAPPAAPLAPRASTATASATATARRLPVAAASATWPTVLLNPGVGVQVVTAHVRLPPFRLGMVLADLVATLALSPVAPFAPVEFKYSDVNPLMVNFSLDVPGCGLRLTVDSRTQLLVAAEVRNCRIVQVMFKSAVVSSPTSEVNFQAVCERLGPAHPGRVVDDAYILPYEGMLVSFALPEHLQAHAGLNRDLARDLLRHAAGVVPTRFEIVPPGDLPTLPAPLTVRVPPLVPVPTLEFPGDDPSAPAVVLALGATPEDVLAALGAPEGYHEKPHAARHAVAGRGPAATRPDRAPAAPGLAMLPSPLVPQGHTQAGGDGGPEADGSHAADTDTGGADGHAAAVGTVDTDVGAAAHARHRPPTVPQALGASVLVDYAYNYFSRGLDVLFDGATHTAHTWVLHTNFPGHPDFNLYRKCHFRLLAAPLQPSTAGRPLQPIRIGDDNRGGGDNGDAGGVVGPLRPGSAGANAGWAAAAPDDEVVDLDGPAPASPAPVRTVRTPPPALAASHDERGSSPAPPETDLAASSTADLLGVPELAPHAAVPAAGSVAAAAAGASVVEASPLGGRAIVIVPETTWEVASRDLCREGAELDRPLIHGRPLHQNPFGPTLFYGVSGLVFEVMRRNDYLSSIAVYLRESDA